MGKKATALTRRQFIECGMLGLTAVTVGSGGPFSLFSGTPAHAQATQPGVINLGMTTADVEMVDTNKVPHWVYTLNDVPTLPGPVIFAFEDETITINVTNGIGDRDRGFAVVGNDFAGNPFALVKQTGPIAPGQTGSLLIEPDDLEPGTYLYKDPTLDPISRVMGLHGALIILPSPTATNPYGESSTAQVTALFDDLGAWEGDPLDPEALFPGQPWFATTDANEAYDPHSAPPSSESDLFHHDLFAHHFNLPVFERFLYRTRIWLHSSIDPELNREVISGTLTSPAQFKNRFNPQYYSVNGRQGVFAHHAVDTMPASTIGEPHVIRLLNAGLAAHSPHLHANHFYVTSVNNVVGGASVYFGNDGSGPEPGNVFFLDSMTLAPEDRIDWVAAYVRPPDIPRVLTDGSIHRPGDPVPPGATLMPLEELIPEELALELGGVPQNPLSYPMHSHMELDQTAAGGNYPQGAVLGWEIIGEFGKLFQGGA